MTDIVSHLDLALYPMVGLVLFLVVWLGWAWRLVRRGKSEMEAASRMALEDGEVARVEPVSVGRAAGRREGGAA